MANRIRHLQKHQLLITPRIEFRLAPPPPLPLLTPRVEFDPDRLVRSRPPSDEGNEGGSNKRRRLSFSGRHASEDSDEHDDDPPGEASASSPSTLKPKPAGEPGKPGSGGFSLENVLINVHKWAKKDYDALYVCSKFPDTFDLLTWQQAQVKEEVNKTLDMTRSFRYQDKGKVQEICEKVRF
jgi:hypothetical protein